MPSNIYTARFFGMYGRLYERLPEFERATGARVELSFTGTHPQLNAHLAGLDVVPYHLVSTHTKYAPSQKRFLVPLEGFDTSEFFPTLLALATLDGALYGIPRNIDVRLLHYRTDLIDRPPRTWIELMGAAMRLTDPPRHHGFVFTGTESGLLGTFVELAESAGARIFPPSLIPELNNEAGRWALGFLRELYTSGAAPKALIDWHYDEVHRYFRGGHAAMVSDWPGYYGSYGEDTSAVRGRFRVARMPAGPTGRTCCYAGSHTFALTRAGGANPAARELLKFLTAPEQQEVEARQGSVPVRRSVMDRQRGQAAGHEAERLDLLGASIERDLFTPPRLASYPEIEEILWRQVRGAMTGETDIGATLANIEILIAERLASAV